MPEPPALRVVAWNIRAGGGRRVEALAGQLARWRADVVALAEYRGTPPGRLLAAGLAEAGLVHQEDTVAPRDRAANRLLVASRWPLTRLVLSRGLERTGRWLAVRVQAGRPFTLGAMHVPNRVTGRKWAFLAAVLRAARRWPEGPGLLAGDTNSGRIGLDEARPAFNQREDGWMRALAAAGWADAFRHLYGQRREWTWHSPNLGTGFRIDQAFANPALAARLRRARHLWGRLPGAGPARRDALSDHAALVLDLAP